MSPHRRSRGFSLDKSNLGLHARIAYISRFLLETWSFVVTRQDTKSFPSRGRKETFGKFYNEKNNRPEFQFPQCPRHRGQLILASRQLTPNILTTPHPYLSTTTHPQSVVAGSR